MLTQEQSARTQRVDELIGSAAKSEDVGAKAVELIFGRWRSQILHAAVKLGVFDAISNTSKNAPTAAGELSLDPDMLYRLMRALGSLGLVTEDDSRSFSLTPVGEMFCKDNPHTLRAMTLLEEGPEHYAVWKHLPALIKEGKQNGFVREFGQGCFEYAAKNPSYGTIFNEAMSSFSFMDNMLVLEALDSYDFSRFSYLCDVAGGHGYTLCNLLAQHRHLRGTVLELPNVISAKEKLWAGKLGVADRCSYVSGDMFEAVPSADAYMLKRVLHDWDDAECLQILSTIHRSAPKQATVFIMEQVIPGPETPHFSKLFDIHMLVWGTGLERTVEQYAELLQRSGWSYRHTWHPRSRQIGVIEAVKT